MIKQSYIKCDNVVKMFCFVNDGKIDWKEL